MSVLMIVLIIFAALVVAIIDPWRWRELRTVLAAPPPPVWTPKTWWADVIVRWARILRRFVALILTSMLAAIVAVDLTNPVTSERLNSWTQVWASFVLSISLVLVVPCCIELSIRLAQVTNSVEGLKKRDQSVHAVLGFFAGLFLFFSIGLCLPAGLLT